MAWRQGHLPIAGAFVRQFLERASCPPAKAAAVLARAGLEPAELTDPELRVSDNQFSQILIGLSRATRDEFWGLGSAPVPLALSDLCRLVASCHTLGEALVVGGRFYQLMVQDFALKVRTEGSVSVVWLKLHADQASVSRSTEMQGAALFIVYQLMCWLTDRRLPLEVVQFSLIGDPEAQNRCKPTKRRTLVSVNLTQPCICKSICWRCRSSPTSGVCVGFCRSARAACFCVFTTSTESMTRQRQSCVEASARIWSSKNLRRA